MMPSRIVLVLAAALAACGAGEQVPSTAIALHGAALVELDDAWVGPAPTDATMVIVSDRISVGADSLVSLVDRRVTAADKLGGEHALMITRLRDGLEPTRGRGTLALGFDGATPFRTVAEVVYTGMQSEPRTLVFLVRHHGAIASVPIEIPRFRDDRGDVASSFSVEVSAEGATVRNAGGRLAPDCERAVEGAGITVPVSADGAQDLASLARCLARVASERPHDLTITVSADPEIRFDDVVRAIAITRGSELHPLFPEVLLAIAAP